MDPETVARMDALFEEFAAALRADVSELVDFATFCATGKLPPHRAITLEEFDRRADAAAATRDRAHAKARAQRAAGRDVWESGAP